MELMDTSFDQCYRHIYGVLQDSIPEDILGVSSLAVRLHSHICMISALYIPGQPFSQKAAKLS